MSFLLLKNILGECMMNTEVSRIYNEEDIEILDDGISIDNTFFSKEQLAMTFNELLFMRNFIGNL